MQMAYYYIGEFKHRVPEFRAMYNSFFRSFADRGILGNK